MRIDDIVAKAQESNGKVGEALFGLIVGSEYAVAVNGTKYIGTLYGIENGKFILRSGTKTTDSNTSPYERAEISLGSRRNFYRM